MPVTKKQVGGKGPRRYTDEEKMEYVKEAEKYDSLAEAARALKLNASMLGRWVRGQDPGTTGATQASSTGDGGTAPRAGASGKTLVAQLDEEIAGTEARLEALQTAKAALQKEAPQ